MSFTTTAASQPSTTLPPTPAPLFSDVSASYWGYDAISSLSGKEIVSGYPDGTFKPDGQITRAEFVTLVVKALNLKPNASQTPTFTDVNPSDWFYQTVETAVYSGLVKGYGNSFNPNQLVTRQEMSIILVNALGQQEEAMTNMNAKTNFTDDASIFAWSRGFVAVAVKDSLIKGYPDGSFSPQGDATRAEACAMVENLLKINQ
jgi:hypothetical protein